MSRATPTTDAAPARADDFADATSGPWRAAACCYGWDIHSDDGHWVGSANNDHNVARSSFPSNEAGAANARLIAAAPALLAERDALRAEVAELREALAEIAKGEGRFSLDPLTHASNTIEDMIAAARAALAKVQP